MASPKSERRLLENEVFFRQSNESVFRRIARHKKIASEEGNTPTKLDDDTPLYFYCECADENCKKRIKLTPREYQKIHSERDTFTIARGHEVEDIEDIINKTPEYYVAKKHRQPPKFAAKLNPTSVDNS